MVIFHVYVTLPEGYLPCLMDRYPTRMKHLSSDAKYYTCIHLWVSCFWGRPKLFGSAVRPMVFCFIGNWVSHKGHGFQTWWRQYCQNDRIMAHNLYHTLHLFFYISDHFRTLFRSFRGSMFMQNLTQLHLEKRIRGCVKICNSSWFFVGITEW